MKIAIPVIDNALCMHFGHCEHFAIVEVNESEQKVVGTTLVSPPPHEPGVLPPWLASQGVSLVIAGGMGQRAQQIFVAKGVRVVTGAPQLPPEELALRFIKGQLELGSNTCDH